LFALHYDARFESELASAYAIYPRDVQFIYDARDFICAHPDPALSQYWQYRNLYAGGLPGEFILHPYYPHQQASLRFLLEPKQRLFIQLALVFSVSVPANPHVPLAVHDGQGAVEPTTDPETQHEPDKNVIPLPRPRGWFGSRKKG
jgi:hypothetical protein